jgi:hypothetical protein
MAFAIVALLSGCVRSGAFLCGGDEACVIDGVAGRCEPVGYCSFPDPFCADGRRFGDHAGVHSNECVSVGGGGDGGIDSDSAAGDTGTPSTTVIISQFYASGSKSNQAFRRDYVVLMNVDTTPADLTDWSFQHYKTTVGWKALALPMVSIPAGGTFLIGLYYDGGGESGTALPTPDLAAPDNSDWNLSTGTGESVAIVNSTAVLTACTSPTIVDLVGFNGSAPCAEGAGVAPTSTDTLASKRKNMGMQDTNDNAADFQLGTANP